MVKKNGTFEHTNTRTRTWNIGLWTYIFSVDRSCSPFFGGVLYRDCSQKKKTRITPAVNLLQSKQTKEKWIKFFWLEIERQQQYSSWKSIAHEKFGEQK